MPTYIVTGPDGREYEIEAPEGATEADVLAYAQQNYQSADAPQAEAAPAKTAAELTGITDEQLNPTTGMGFGSKFLAGMGASVDSSIKGVQQLGYMAADQIPGVDLSQERGQLQVDIDTAKAANRPLMDTGAGLAGNITGYGLQMVGPGMAASGTRLAGAALPTTFSGAAAQGAALGTLQPVASDESRLANAGLGAVAGVAGQAAGKVLGASAQRAKDAIPDDVRALYAAAKERGIQLTPAQLSDSKFMKYLSSTLREMPLSGAEAKAAKQSGQWNQAVAKAIGVDDPVITSNVYAGKKAKDSAAFDALTERNSLKVTDRLINSMQNIAETAKISPDIKAQVDAAIDSLYARSAIQNGKPVIHGPAYQAFDSELNQIIKSGGPTAHFLGNVQSAVRREMDASISPQDAKAWAQLRTEYGNRKTIRDLVAKGEDKPLSPASLMSRVTANNSGREAMAAGTRGELGTLAKIGQRMKEPANSGTVGRAISANSLNPLAWPALAGMAAIGSTAGRVVNSNALASMMMRENAGATRKMAGNALNRLAIPAFPAAKGALYDADLEVMGGGGTQPVTEAELEQLRAEMRARRAKAGNK